MSSQSLHFYFLPFYILLVGTASCDVIQGKKMTESMAASNNSEDTEEINSDNIFPINLNLVLPKIHLQKMTTQMTIFTTDC